MIRFILNNTPIATNQPPGMVLLDFIRYHRQLTGTKIGCREGDCGACTVLVGEWNDGKLLYKSMTSCLLPIGNAEGKHIVTVEGINGTGLTPVQEAMAGEGATQCGFCTPGFVISLTGFCLSNQKPTMENAVAAIDGNICRCTGYKSIERAAGRLVTLLKDRKKTETCIEFCVRHKILPDYFLGIPERMSLLQESEKSKIKALSAAQTKTPRLVAGGTDLYVQQHDEMTNANIKFLLDEPGHNVIHIDGNECVLGPAVTVTDLAKSGVFSELFTYFPEYIKLVSSTPIRNMATIAGNFINASPIGDFTVFFLALDAKLKLKDGEQERLVPLRKLYKGYKILDKTPEEQITEIRFELHGTKTCFHFEKVSKRRNLDIASVNSACNITSEKGIIGDAAISAGGVGPIPLYLEKTSAWLTGKPVNKETLAGAIAMMETEISPISDARGSAAYKKLLLGQLIKAHFAAIFPEYELLQPA